VTRFRVLEPGDLVSPRHGSPCGRRLFTGKNEFYRDLVSKDAVCLVISIRLSQPQSSTHHVYVVTPDKIVWTLLEDRERVKLD
jgi:hypothetical protein